MAETPEQKTLLVEVEAGLVIMERYNLFCESKAPWSDPALAPLAERVKAAHAPATMDIQGKPYRINIATPVEKYRLYSLKVLELFIKGASRAPACRTIVLHSPFHYGKEHAGRPCPVQEVGQYDLMIEGLRLLARAAVETGVSLVLENPPAIWDDIPDDEIFIHDKRHGKIEEAFGVSPTEWAKIAEDVNEPNFGLCLDTSHAVTYAQRLPPKGRKGILGLYLDLGGDRLWHVHWNDNMLETVEGRRDQKLILGKGTIPRDVNDRVWRHASARAYLFEHWTHEGDLATDLRFIERLE